MINQLKSAAAALILLLSISSCSSEEKCGEEFPVKEFFEKVISRPNAHQDFSAEKTHHEIVFSMSDDGKICSFGYQSYNCETDLIEFQVFNDHDDLLYFGKFDFSHRFLEFHTIPDIDIQSDRKYRIVRKVQGTLGTVLYDKDFISSGVTFPYTVDNFTIHSVYYYRENRSAEGIDFFYVPRLEFGFTAN